MRRRVAPGELVLHVVVGGAAPPVEQPGRGRARRRPRRRSPPCPPPAWWAAQRRFQRLRPAAGRRRPARRPASPARSRGRPGASAGQPAARAQRQALAVTTSSCSADVGSRYAQPRRRRAVENTCAGPARSSRCTPRARAGRRRAHDPVSSVAVGTAWERGRPAPTSVRAITVERACSVSGRCGEDLRSAEPVRGRRGAAIGGSPWRRPRTAPGSRGRWRPARWSRSTARCGCRGSTTSPTPCAVSCCCRFVVVNALWMVLSSPARRRAGASPGEEPDVAAGRVEHGAGAGLGVQHPDDQVAAARACVDQAVDPLGDVGVGDRRPVGPLPERLLDVDDEKRAAS